MNKLRLNRLSRAGVLVSVLLLGCAGCGRIAANNAIAEIEKQDAEFLFDGESPVWVQFRGPRVTDAGLAHLKGLIQLKRRNLWGTKVTDAGVSELKKALPNVEIIN